MPKPKDKLGTAPPNPREAHVGAIHAGPPLSFDTSTKKGGFKLASQSSNLQSRPSKEGRKSGNTYKAKPGAK